MPTPHDPTVTIWIPSYNHGRFLREALDSALAQTFDDFEVIVVDDGSTDDSLAVAESYAARHPEKVRVYTHPGRRNLGISATSNFAFRQSRGRYVSGLASDDVLLPEKLERQVAYLDANPELGWAYSLVEVIDEDGRPHPGYGRLGRDVTRDPDPVESLILHNSIPAISVLMRRSLVEAVGEHDPALVYSDWDFWVRMMAHGRAGFLPVPLVKHRAHTQSTSLGVEPGVGLRRAFEVMRALRRKASSVGGGLARPRTQALLDLQSAFFAYRVGETDEAARALAAAFETDPSLAGAGAYFAAWLKGRAAEIDEAAQPGADGRGFSAWVTANLPVGLGGAFKRRASAVAFAAAAAAETDAGRTRRMAFECLKRDPRRLGDAALRRALVRGALGGRLLGWLRRVRRAPAGPGRA